MERKNTYWVILDGARDMLSSVQWLGSPWPPAPLIPFLFLASQASLFSSGPQLTRLPIVVDSICKVPWIAFEKFLGSQPILTIQMQFVGESMAVGRTFRESF